MIGCSESARPQNVIVIEPREIDDIPTEQSNFPEESSNNVMTHRSGPTPKSISTVLQTNEEISKVTDQGLAETSTTTIHQVRGPEQMVSSNYPQPFVRVAEANTTQSISTFRSYQQVKGKIETYCAYSLRQYNKSNKNILLVIKEIHVCDLLA